MSRVLLVCCVLLTLATAQGPTEMLRPQEARRHIGEYATVCGYVAGVRGGSGAAMLDFEEPAPVQIFGGLISARNRSRFPDLSREYLNHDICVTGTIRKTGQNVYMDLLSPRQITPARPKGQS